MIGDNGSWPGFFPQNSNFKNFVIIFSHENFSLYGILLANTSPCPRIVCDVYSQSHNCIYLCNVYFVAFGGDGGDSDSSDTDDDSTAVPV